MRLDVCRRSRASSAKRFGGQGYTLFISVCFLHYLILCVCAASDGDKLEATQLMEKDIAVASEADDLAASYSPDLDTNIRANKVPSTKPLSLH